MFKIIIKGLLLIIALVVLFSLYMANRMDVFKTLTVKTPDVCSALPINGSAEDLEIDFERGIAYLSLEDRAALITGDDIQGTVVKINLKKTPYKVELALNQQPPHFRPHGISLYIDTNGKRHLGIINHPKNRELEPENVELFSEDENGLFMHQQTITDPLFKSPNALVLMAQNKFYLGNDKGAETAFGKIQEQLGRPMSKIIYFNGDSASVAAENLSQISGINTSKNNKYLFASETAAKRIAIFSINENNGVLKKLETIKINGSPDNINVSSNDDLIVAAIPKVMALIQHFISFQKEEIMPAPSQVFQIKWDFNSEATIEELFLSNGEDISTTSAGAIFDSKLFMGSITDKKLLICDL